MSAMLARLVEQLKQRGLSVGPGREPGQLLLHGPDKEKTPELMAAVKLFKPQLLKLYVPDQSPREGQSSPSSPEVPAADPEPESPDEFQDIHCRTCAGCLYTLDPAEVARVCRLATCPHQPRRRW